MTFQLRPRAASAAPHRSGRVLVAAAAITVLALSGCTSSAKHSTTSSSGAPTSTVSGSGTGEVAAAKARVAALTAPYTTFGPY